MIDFPALNQKASRISKPALLKSCLIGGILGLSTSTSVNYLLLQIYISPIFTTYFAFVFLAFGINLLVKAKRQIAEEEVAELDNTLRNYKKNHLQKNAAILVIISSLFCFILESSFTHNHRYAFKTIMYLFIAMSMTYTSVCSTIQMYNWLVLYFNPKTENQNDRPGQKDPYLPYGQSKDEEPVGNFLGQIIENQDQVLSLLINCFVCGGIFGLIFAQMDVEDKGGAEMRGLLEYEEKICLPIGMIGGVIGGFMNQLMSDNC